MSGTTDNYSLPYPTGEDAVDVATDIQGLAEAVDTLVKESLAKYLPLAGGTMTGTITNARSGGSWISGKSGALFADFTTPVVETGSRYDPYMRGCDTAGNYWNFGGGADGKIGTVGFAADRTANDTDWRTYQDIETGVIGCSGTATIYAGYLTSSAAGGGTTGLSVGDANTPVYFTGGRPAACTSLDLSTTGNAATATKFASSQTVALTGDVTGSSSSTAGWSVATTLASSGVTAGSYGPSANASPSAGGTFSVPYVTVDAKGRVTAASTKTITLPSGGGYTLPVATTDTLGGVKASTSSSTSAGVSVDTDGVMGVDVATTSTLGTVIVPKSTTSTYAGLAYKGAISITADNKLFCPIGDSSSYGAVCSYGNHGTQTSNGRLYTALPYLTAYCNSSQTLTKSAATLTWTLDSNANIYARASTGFYVNVSGYYLVSATVGVNSLTSGDSVHVSFWSDDEELYNTWNRPSGTSGAVSFTHAFKLTAGMYYYVKAYNATGARGTVATGSTSATKYTVVYLYAS